MPSVSKAQATASRIALAAKKGEIPQSKLHGASKQMAKMPISSLKEFAHTQSKNLPSHKK